MLVAYVVEMLNDVLRIVLRSLTSSQAFLMGRAVYEILCSMAPGMQREPRVEESPSREETDVAAFPSLDGAEQIQQGRTSQEGEPKDWDAD